jgi:putative membrane protein insertion efficiency factor
VDKIRKFIVELMILVIKAYRLFVSPILVNHCRFWPTCSKYAIESLKYHGPVKGVFLIIKRLLRCHPFSPGGVDPVNK